MKESITSKYGRNSKTDLPISLTHSGFGFISKAKLVTIILRLNSDHLRISPINWFRVNCCYWNDGFWQVKSFAMWLALVTIQKTNFPSAELNWLAHVNFGTFISIYVLSVFKSFDPNSHYKVDCAISCLNVVYCICSGQNVDWSYIQYFFMTSSCGGSESCLSFTRTPLPRKLNKS